MKKVIDAMLSMQRYPWEQGVCAQALYEAGLDEYWIPMAYDAIKRMSDDGRLAMIGGDVAVSDPASNGEVCLRAYEKTGDRFFLEGAEKMLSYLMDKAPRTDDGIICHNNVSFTEGYSAYQLWIDGLYMVPPFLAVMGKLDEAAAQVRGYVKHLYDRDAHLFYHIVDTKDGRFLRKVHWATGNGWAVMGLARIIEEASRLGRDDLREEFAGLLNEVLDAMLKLQLPDGRFRDIIDDPSSFIDGTSAMMAAAAIYRGTVKGYIGKGVESTGDNLKPWIECADRAFETVTSKIDEMGLVREVAGCPHFLKEGTSAEAQAAYIMAGAWRNKYEGI